MKAAMDEMSWHGIESLVAPEDRDSFLKALDEGYQAPTNEAQQATWYKGQQIHLNVDGTIESEWETRADNLNRFEEL
eukprot:CAMPEP_0172464224 /NCGR_PEP_ID=MMETSP1065-20121228/49820_1 /TAXON_ID=265537 /ORGANISM="Amphiprora paludosa, Strain CCMP125" /LENGTH=76 /DNA_ID=CAMNT_0013220401 /DNA_START=1 /DNA_END=231 /DNA_ORIENTATION=+